MQTIITSAILGYLIGSIPFSYFIGKKTKNLDLRQHGSGNLGATNVVRVAGKKAGIVAFILDLLKGVGAYIAGFVIMGIPGAAISSGFAVIGHCYSVFTNFRGGKGVSTTYGILVAFNPLLAISLLVIQFIIVKATKYMSLGSILSAISIPILGLIYKMPREFIYLSIFLAIIITYRHKGNIKKLIHGNENKFNI